jgi:hypothetical protein
VSIKNFEFGPREITITAGQSVVWHNDDGAPHSLAFKDGAKGTDLLLPGAQFTRRFDDTGTHDYVCSVHPYMSGTVVVRRPTATASIAQRCGKRSMLLAQPHAGPLLAGCAAGAKPGDQSAGATTWGCAGSRT